MVSSARKVYTRATLCFITKTQSFECVHSKIIHRTTLRTAFCSSRGLRDDVVDATCSCNTVDR